MLSVIYGTEQPKNVDVQNNVLFRGLLWQKFYYYTFIVETNNLRQYTLTSESRSIGNPTVRDMEELLARAIALSAFVNNVVSDLFGISTAHRQMALYRWIQKEKAF